MDKTKLRYSFAIVTLILIMIASSVSAQYGGYVWSTAYQVVNIGSDPADIFIDYFDSNGDVVSAAHKEYNDVPVNSSRLVVQFSDDPNLTDGRYSAVITSTQEIAAIANQQLVATGATSYNPQPPFSTYSGEREGATQITLSSVMYNWYGYYTEVAIMNVGDADATDVDITYIPSSLNGFPTGSSGVTDLNNTIPKYASINKSQQSLSTLGAPGGGNPWSGRFLGTAIITADKPIVAVVNQHNTDAYKLMTYNGFSSGSTHIAAPIHMRGYFTYYTTLLIANPHPSNTANVRITYTPIGPYNVVSSGSVSPVLVEHSIAPRTTLTRYDGPTATDEQSDLDDSPVYTRFYGSVTVESLNAIDVVVQVNVEAVASGDDQAGSYNGIPISEATQDIVAPIILADFYGYYTTLIIQNVTNTAGSCDITYTSDSIYSAVPNHSDMYTHPLPASGILTVYEGRKGGQEIGDINSDTQWRSGSRREFIGTATIHCTVNAVAFVNEESDILLKDSMYTFNTFNR